MEKKARFVKVVKIESEHYHEIEAIVNRNIELLRNADAKIISIQVIGIPFLMYNIIYEAEKEWKEQSEPEKVNDAVKEEKPETSDSQTNES